MRSNYSIYIIPFVYPREGARMYILYRGGRGGGEGSGLYSKAEDI